MRTPRPLSLLLIPIAACLGLAACTSSTDLEPSPAGNLVAKNTEAATVAGVTMTAEVDYWDDHPSALEYTTPIWVSVQNHSGRPIEVRYRNFEIRTESGATLAALAPYDIDGEILVRVDDPDFRHDRFYVYRNASSTYPRMPVADAALYDYDDGFYDYYDAYNDTWAEIALPTPGMVARALPEGVLENGGSVAGYVYFQEIDDDDDIIEAGSMSEDPTVWLQADLVDAANGNSLGRIEMPFRVD